MNESPLVSICIPTYNRAGLVKKAIDSALSQTYTNIEILVVDNASTDNIEDIISDYSDVRLKFFKNKRKAATRIPESQKNLTA
jgi:glycosyltransferase involved in cell wall biosynthesis